MVCEASAVLPAIDPGVPPEPLPVVLVVVVVAVLVGTPCRDDVAHVARRRTARRAARLLRPSSRPTKPVVPTPCVLLGFVGAALSKRPVNARTVFNVVALICPAPSRS